MIISKIKFGLGNQMFQYACARAYALKSGEKLYLDTVSYNNRKERKYSLNHMPIVYSGIISSKYNPKRFYPWIVIRLLNLLKADRMSEKTYCKMTRYGYFSTNLNRYVGVPKTRFPIKYYDAYFQSEKYFKEYADTIKKELRVKTKPSPNNEEWIEKIKSLENPVCIHIRRGDYVNDDTFRVCTEKYYKEAVDVVKKEVSNPTFVVFSEDIDYARKLFQDDKFLYVNEDNPDYEELRLMYTCRHFIISNSTFSWWGQYLTENDNRVVIAPTKWFGVNKNGNKDIYMEDWILVSP